MLAQAECDQRLGLTLGSDEESNQQADAATVHIFQISEIQDYRLSVADAGLCVGIHQCILSERIHLTLDIHDASLVADLTHGDCQISLGCHRF